jgi:hypothetical protein
MGLRATAPYGNSASAPLGLNNWQGYSWMCQNAGRQWSALIRGNRYARFEVRDGDIVSFDVGGADLKNRSEAFIPNDTGLTQFPYGSAVWLSFALRVPSWTSLTPIDPMPVGQAANLGVAQMHGPSSSSPPWSLVLRPSGDLVMMSSGNWAGGSSGSESTRATISSLTRDTWHQFVFSLTFNNAANGHVDAWRNGSSFFSADVLMGYNAAADLYMKVGTYRHNMTGVSVLEYANVECGTTDLTGRVATPLALP